MMTRPPRPDQRVGVVRVALEIDLTTGTRAEHLDEVCAHVYRPVRGQVVALRVGRTTPLDDHDPRLVPLLRDVLTAGVNLQLIGSSQAVDDWADVLYAHYPTPPPPSRREPVPRHLAVAR